ncbi:MAG: SDR family oxidoreductase, partial [Pseudomonadota bacterium]
EAAAEAVQARAPRFDAVIIASGWLHDAQHQPEKSVRSLSMSAFERAYAINAAGPLTLLAALLPALRAPTGTPRTRIMVLSAKVGSIGDNSLGGWHSYRMAKAALNMGVRNLGIEFARNARSPLIAAVHPGTTETPLSAPFAKRGLPVMRAATTAARLLDFLSAMTDDHQGGFFHWDGSPLPP